MKKQFIVSWLLRGLGVLFILVYFFGGSRLGELFPGLLGQSLNPVFYVGVLFYVSGAIYYRVLFRKERAARKKEIADELLKANSDDSH